MNNQESVKKLIHIAIRNGFDADEFKTKHGYKYFQADLARLIDKYPELLSRLLDNRRFNKCASKGVVTL